MMQIPLSTIPKQKLSIILDNQNCVMRVYQLDAAVYMDLIVGDVQVFVGAICQDRLNIKAYNYLPFRGGLYFIDLQGNQPPHCSGFGSRWVLLFVGAAEDVPAGLRP